MVTMVNSSGSTSSIGLHRVIKVLCVFLAILTYLLLYVIGNAIIAPTAIHVVIQRPKNGGHKGRNDSNAIGGPVEIVSSSLETLFRNLNSTRCSSSFKSHLLLPQQFPTMASPRVIDISRLNLMRFRNCM